MHLTSFSLAIIFLTSTCMAQAAPTPECRLDSSLIHPVEQAAKRAIDIYSAIGIYLPFQEITVNQSSSSNLEIEIVIDATLDHVNRNGCIKPGMPTISVNQPFDQFTVQGGCYVSSESDHLIRCSSNAIHAFVGKDFGNAPASPALLYVLAHEIAHIHQGRRGEFTGKIETVDLKKSVQDKRGILMTACEPKNISKEKEADEIALKVLLNALPKTPYKDPTLSTRGSIYWNIDKINLEANQWVEVNMKLWGMNEAKVHESFVPKEFPTPESKIKMKAHKFVCDVLTNKNGTVLFPLRQTTHPAIEQRIRKIAEELKPLADQFPSNDGSKDFAPVANLQNDLSPIFTQIYKETGIYLEAMHREVCTLINSELPIKDCSHSRKKHSQDVIYSSVDTVKPPESIDPNLPIQGNRTTTEGGYSFNLNSNIGLHDNTNPITKAVKGH